MITAGVVVTRLVIAVVGVEVVKMPAIMIAVVMTMTTRTRKKNKLVSLRGP